MNAQMVHILYKKLKCICNKYLEEFSREMHKSISKAFSAGILQEIFQEFFC